MRRFAALLVVLLALPAAAQEIQTGSFFARSQHYSINVDVLYGSPDAIRGFNVTVIDLATNAVVAQPFIPVTSSESLHESDAGDRHFRIAVRPARNMISAMLEVSKGDTILDSIRAGWALKPYPKQAGGVVGGEVVRRPLPPGTYRVGGDVKAPVVIHRVEPVYTEEARKARISGIVIVEALIDKTGVVRDVQVLKPLPFGLDQAAADAVKQWLFNPATLNGQPVDVVFNLTVNFHIHEGTKEK